MHPEKIITGYLVFDLFRRDLGPILGRERIESQVCCQVAKELALV